MMGDPWATYDAWLEGPATDGSDAPCESCNDEGCHRCNKKLADEYAAELAMDRIDD